MRQEFRPSPFFEKFTGKTTAERKREIKKGEPEKPGFVFLERLKGIERDERAWTDERGREIGTERIRRGSLGRGLASERIEIVNHNGSVEAVKLTVYDKKTGEFKEFRRLSPDGEVLREVRAIGGGEVVMKDFDRANAGDQPVYEGAYQAGVRQSSRFTRYAPHVRTETGAVEAVEQFSPDEKREMVPLVTQFEERIYSDDGVTKTRKKGQHEYEPGTGRVVSESLDEMVFEGCGAHKETSWRTRYGSTPGDWERIGQIKTWENSEGMGDPKEEEEVFERFVGGHRVERKSTTYRNQKIQLANKESDLLLGNRRQLYESERRLGRKLFVAEGVDVETGRTRNFVFEKKRVKVSSDVATWRYDEKGRLVGYELKSSSGYWRREDTEYDEYNRVMKKQDSTENRQTAIENEYRPKARFSRFIPEEIVRLRVTDLKTGEVKLYRKAAEGESWDRDFRGFVREHTE